MLCIFCRRLGRSIFIGALLLLLAAIPLSCGGAKSDRLRAEGDELLREGRVEEAKKLYEQAIDADARNPYAHGRLGQILSRQGSEDEALEALREAIRLQPDWVLAYIEASRILLKQGDVSGAEELASSLSEVNPETGAILEAFVMRKDGRTEDAVALLEERVGENGDSAALRVNLAISLLETDRPEEAETHLKTVLDEIDSDSTPARMWLIETYRAQGRLDDMVGEYEELVAQRPDDESAKLALALVLLDAGREQDALDLARPVVDNHPDSGWAHYVAGTCYFALDDRANATRHLEAASRMLPDQPVVARRLALARGEITPPVRDTAGAPDTQAPSPSTAEDWRTLWHSARLGELLNRRGEFLAESDSILPNILVLSAMFVGNFSLAEELIQDVPEDSPVRAYYDAFRQLLVPTEPAEAGAKLEALRDAIDAWQSEEEGLQHLKKLAEGYALATIQMRSEAFGIYHQTLQEWPDNAVPLRNLAAMYMSADMPEFAASALRRLIELKGNTPELRSLLYQALNAADQEDKAVTFAEATYSVDPTNPEVVATLARLYLRAGEIDGALRVLDAAVEEMPDEEPLEVLRAGALVRKGQPDRALDILAEVDVPPILERTAAEVRAFALSQKDQWEAVVTTLERQDSADYTTGGQILLAAAYAHLGRMEDARAALPGQGRTAEMRAFLARVLGTDDAVENDRDSALADVLSESPEDAAAFVYAVACRSSQLFERSFNVLRDLHETYPEEHQLLRYVLEVLAGTKTIDDRSTVAEELTKDRPDVADIWAGLAEVYGSDDETSGERVALERAAELAPERPDILNQLARFAIREHEDALALNTFERLVELEPENPSVLNNYAYYILETGGDPGRAEGYAVKALDKLPNNPNVMHTVGLAQFQQGKLEEGGEHLERALRMRPGDPTLSLDYGKLLMSRDEDEQGLRYVQLALLFAQNLGLDFPRKDEAEAIIQRHQTTVAPA